jgi:hypothetical protein
LGIGGTIQECVATRIDLDQCRTGGDDIGIYDTKSDQTETDGLYDGNDTKRSNQTTTETDATSTQNEEYCGGRYHYHPHNNNNEYSYDSYDYGREEAETHIEWPSKHERSAATTIIGPGITSIIIVKITAPQ